MWDATIYSRKPAASAKKIMLTDMAIYFAIHLQPKQEFAHLLGLVIRALTTKNTSQAIKFVSAQPAMCIQNNV